MEKDKKPEVLFTESPASWNTRYITPEGYICQITLRGENGKDLLEKVGLALAYLAEHNYLPDTGYRKYGNGGNNGNGQGKICPIHGVEMKKREKDGKTWYSHKTQEGSWCYGKPQKKGDSHD
ncbi:hypothetical protein ACFLXB_04175 [Chloroflexota bacterium]